MQVESQDWKDTLEVVLANPEFSLLDVSSETLRSELETRRSSIDTLVSEEQNEFRAAKDREETARENWLQHSSFLWGLICFAVVAASVALVIWRHDWWIPMLALALVSVGAYQVYRVRFNRKEDDLHTQYQQLRTAASSSQKKLQAALSAAMLQELRALTAELRVRPWREDDLSAIPPSEVVESDASERHLDITVQDDVSRFIIGQTTGAIAIAGPRGVGKSTLLRHLVDNPPGREDSAQTSQRSILSALRRTRRPRGDPLCCFVSAPVRYDFTEFLLYLYASMCRLVLPAEAQHAYSKTRRGTGSRPVLVIAIALALASALLILFSTGVLADRSRRIGLTLGVLTIFVGVVLLPWTKRLMAPRLVWYWRLCGLASFGLLAAGSYYCYVALADNAVGPVDHLRAAGIACAVISITGLLVCGVVWIIDIVGRFMSLLTRSAPLPWSDQITFEAGRRLYSIRYQQTIATTVGAGLKGPSGLQGSVERQFTRSERPMPLPELVQEFRDFIQILADKGGAFGGRKAPYVLIAIDELDKIESADAVAQFINELKSLFLLPHCYFLVSVSIDVLRSFSRSGARLQDAFDSAFDTVDPMSYWPVYDCARLLDLKVQGLSRLAEVFCYAHSGGLPRDLIRIGHRVAGEARGAGAGTTLPALVRPLLQIDIDGLLEAALAQENGTSEQTRSAPVASFAEAVRKVLHDSSRLSAICQQYRQGPLLLDGDRSVSGGSTIPVGVLSGVYLLATLGEVFCSDFTLQMRTEPAHRERFIQALDQLARARQSLNGHPETAWAAVREARLHVGLAVEQTATLNDWRNTASYL